MAPLITADFQGTRKGTR